MSTVRDHRDRQGQPTDRAAFGAVVSRSARRLIDGLSLALDQSFARAARNFFKENTILKMAIWPLEIETHRWEEVTGGHPPPCEMEEVTGGLDPPLCDP